MLYRLIDSLKKAIVAGFLLALSGALRPLTKSGSAAIDWSPVLVTAGRTFAIYGGVIFVLLFTGILKPKPKKNGPAVSPWFFWIVCGGAVAILILSLT